MRRRDGSGYRRGKEREQRWSVADVRADSHHEGLTEVHRARDTTGEQPPERSPGGQPSGSQSKCCTGRRTEQDTDPQASTCHGNAPQ
ncbi:hypothetical protein P3T35_007342 [Kitasatospora sp. GP30]|nr:hypothetical protein [Kitasatospora sp. GP30]